jgi:broad-specificity NMP kinase
MSYKTVTVDVDVYIDDVINELNDQELIDELKHRGYSVIKGIENVGFEREDYDYLIEMLDKLPFSWYTRRIRDKLFTARHENG